MLRCFCDGSSRLIGGERRGFIGIVGYRDGKIVAEHAAGVGIATSNEAEYYAVIGALSLAKRFGERRVQILSDSELVVRQLSGEYVVANKRLERLVEAFHKLADSFDSVTVEYGTHGRAHLLAAAAKTWDRMDAAARSRFPSHG